MIVNYKSRLLDYSKPVKVYRNLNARHSWNRYSIQQGGLVVAHADTIVLCDVSFVVNEAGRQRVLRTQRKNVHAFAVGIPRYCCGTYGTPLPLKVSYNPYKAKHFVTAEGHKVTGALCSVLGPEGITVAYAIS